MIQLVQDLMLIPEITLVILNKKYNCHLQRYEILLNPQNRTLTYLNDTLTIVLKITNSSGTSSGKCVCVGGGGEEGLVNTIEKLNFGTCTNLDMFFSFLGLNFTKLHVLGEIGSCVQLFYWGDKSKIEL